LNFSGLFLWLSELHGVDVKISLLLGRIGVGAASQDLRAMRAVCYLVNDSTIVDDLDA